ncbi:hypothetical protein ACP70R_000777 [Stipagrostis hirtigluma subsp. patula]
MADIEAAAGDLLRRRRASLWAIAAAAAAAPPPPPRVLLTGAVEAVVCCFASAMCVNYTALIASGMACGEAADPGGSAAFAGEELFVVFDAFFVAAGLFFILSFVVLAVLAMVLLLFGAAALLTLLWRRGSRKAETGGAQIGADGGARMPVAWGHGPRSTGARGSQEGLDGAIITSIRDLAIILLLTIALGLLVTMLAPPNGYCEVKVCYMHLDIQCFVDSARVLLRRFIELFVRSGMERITWFAISAADDMKTKYNCRLLES